MRRFASLSSFFVLFLIAGCSIPRGETPTVSLVDVKFSDLTLFETAAEFVVRIENPNPFDIEIDGATHRLYLNGQEIGKGLSDEGVRVPRLSSATQKVSVRLSNISLVRNFESLIDSKDFKYRIESVLYLPGGFGLSSYEVQNEGHYSGFAG